MKERLDRLYKLKELYTLRILGDSYVEYKNPISYNNVLDNQALENKILHCRLCQRSKMSKPIAGVIGSNSRIIFVTIVPIIDEKSRFLQTRSAKIFQDIINNVFKLASREYSVLSLLKCGETYPTYEDFNLCKTHFFDQIANNQAKNILCFGGYEILKFLDFNRSFFGKLIEFQNKKMIVTYSLNELLKNPSLKKETMQHLLRIKESL